MSIRLRPPDDPCPRCGHPNDDHAPMGRGPCLHHEMHSHFGRHPWHGWRAYCMCPGGAFLLREAFTEAVARHPHGMVLPNG